MVKCNYLNSSNGISRKTSEPYFRVQVIGMTTDGSFVPYEFFTTEQIYEQVKDLRPKAPLLLKCGLSKYGRLTIESVMVEQEGK